MMERLAGLGFTRHEVRYQGCPDHPQSRWACPIDAAGNCTCRKSNAPYWRIDGHSVAAFSRAFMQRSPHLTYVFIDSAIRKIGEGRVRRIADNLKAHYSHGLTKSLTTQADRVHGNLIAKRRRDAAVCLLFVCPAASKSGAKQMEARGKALCPGGGWLDYDRK